MKPVKVLASGTFDLLHPGHVDYLRQAKALGTHLVVVVSTDRNAAHTKGQAPVFPQAQRAELVRSLNMVDEVVFGHEGDILDVVSEIKPDILALGYDQHVNEKELQTKFSAGGLNVSILRCRPFNPEEFKSSKLKNRIRQQ
ncbi:MAG: FAD synthase [Candidatus Diapherotrites archaeon]|nr:FAD synthase [Candidatus Diapherotrites archaeon]